MREPAPSGSGFTPPDDECRAALVLSLLDGIGPRRHADLVARHGSAAAALAAHPDRAGLRRAADRADALLELAGASGARLLARGMAPYPERLADLYAPPAVLWIRGDPELLESPCVAIVGTRHPTSYGERAARELASALAAVPGPIDSPRSKGTNRLLRDGAIVIAEPADALALLGLSQPPERDMSRATRAERALWRALERGATDVDSLVAATDLPLRECLAALTALELGGAVAVAPSGEIRRR